MNKIPVFILATLFLSPTSYADKCDSKINQKAVICAVEIRNKIVVKDQIYDGCHWRCPHTSKEYGYMIQKYEECLVTADCIMGKCINQKCVIMRE